MVLKEQEGTVGRLKAIAVGLDENHLGDPWNALLVFSLFKYAQESKAQVWDAPNIEGTGKHLDSRQIKSQER